MIRYFCDAGGHEITEAEYKNKQALIDGAYYCQVHRQAIHQIIGDLDRERKQRYKDADQWYKTEKKRLIDAIGG